MTDFVSITIAIVIIFMVYRWLSASGEGSQPNRQGQNRGRMTPRTQARLVNPEMVRKSDLGRTDVPLYQRSLDNGMEFFGEDPPIVETVRAMFPHIPTAAIHYDLQKTGSVEQTCDNILRDGTLPMPPAPRPPTPPATSTSSTSTSGSSSATNQSVNGNLVQRFQLQEAAERNVVPDEPSKVWADSAEKRQEVFKSRKEFMVLQARKRFLEQEALKAKENEKGDTTA
ncbi:hypothetical protein KVV02_007245 [Mortierella alpina]|uniref:CUE domain-containing protein n=1 Tax=Mortierella alpina TaxID=64518 RepID=A0A9P8A534_MORAP|nr:hypothetical protein KVV02_007245 [Mortierella alpina]